MRIPPRIIKIDRTGNTSEGNNLCDWSTDSLIDIIDNCWDLLIVDRVKEILKGRKERIEKKL